MYLGIPLCINVVAWSCTPESFDFKPNSDFKSNSDFKPNSNDTMASDVYLLQLFVYPFQNPKIHTLQLHYKSSNQNIKDPNTIQLAKYLNIVATISVYHSAVDYLSLVLRSEFFYFTLFTAAIVTKEETVVVHPFYNFPSSIFTSIYDTTAAELLWVEKDKLSE